MALNLDYARSQFPGLDTEWTRFDNAGGSQTAWPVIHRLNEYYRTSNVQLGGSYEPSRVADRHKIGIRHGDFYAARLIDALGVRPQAGVIRASFVHYNTLDEVNRLVDVLDRLL